MKGVRVGHRRGEIEVLGTSTEDQDFIAHARQDIPALLEEVRRLRSELGRVNAPTF